VLAARRPILVVEDDRAMQSALEVALLLLGARASALADQEVELWPPRFQCVLAEQCGFADQPDKPWLNQEPC
jgi:hypothetical protein